MLPVQCGHPPRSQPQLLCPDLGVAELVLGVVDVQGAQQLLCGLPAVHEGVIRDGTGVQDAVPGTAGRTSEERLGREPRTEEAGGEKGGNIPGPLQAGAEFQWDTY